MSSPPSQPKSSRRSRRRAEAKQPLIAFPVAGETFAVPIGLVSKVVAVEGHGHDLAQAGPRLLPYFDRQIAVIGLRHWLFPAAAPLEPVAPNPSTQMTKDLANSHMLVVQSSHELVGLLVMSQPALIRVPTAAFAPVPTAFLQGGRIRYIGAIVHRTEQDPIFLISIGDLLGQIHAPLGGLSQSKKALSQAVSHWPLLESSAAPE